MRTHRVFPALQPWLWRSDLVRDLASGKHLSTARIEPVTRGREPAAIVDLHFSDGERSVVIPLVYVDLAQLELREFDPLVFPHALLDVVSDAQIRAVVEQLMPHLERTALGGGFWAEDVIRFAPAPLFDRARERGFFGAAPLATSLPRIAGAVYAQRFAKTKHVIAYGAGASELAAVLRTGARSCAAIGDDADDAARAWYGAFDAALPDDECDVAIGSGPAPVKGVITVRVDAAATAGERFTCAAALPADIMLDFAGSAAVAAAAFHVESTLEPFMRPSPALGAGAIAGGSAGRIALVVRPDAALVPAADTDEAGALARALQNEGFTTAVIADAGALDDFAPDLIHLFGVRPGAHARRIAEWASAHRRPLVVHAYYEAPMLGGYWGSSVAPYCFGYSADDRSVAAYLDSLGRRAVEVDGISAGAPFAPPSAGIPDAERVLAMAEVVLVNSERERTVVEAFRPRRPTFVVPPLPVTQDAAVPVVPHVGNDPFILVHAPIGPESNQLVLARAASGVGMALVFAGPVADPSYAERLREFAPVEAMLIGEPPAALVAGLYRTAAVVASAAWLPSGHARLMTAAALGAAVVRSQFEWLDLPDDTVWTVDPADVRSVARGLGNACDAAIRFDKRVAETAEFARQRLQSAAGAVITAYAKIVQAV